MMDLLPVQSDMEQFIEAGASGFIFKDSTSKEFIDTIRSVAKGDKVFPAQMHGSLFSEIVDNSVNELLDSKLIESIRMTENEKKITELVSASFTNKDISKMLGLNVSIVKGYIDNILEKLSLSKHVQIAVYRNTVGNSFNSSDGTRIKTKIFKKIKQKDFSKIKQVF
jgi:DNA-binding NarL/FixJ family response regulator